jgi:ATP-dependent Lon protease
MKTVIIPLQNKKDLEDIPAEILKKVRIVPVSEIGEALRLALEKYPPPAPKQSKEPSQKTQAGVKKTGTARKPSAGARA